MDDGLSDDDFACKLCGRQLDLMKRCSRCKIAFYCSRKCQMKDWTQHKQFCNKDDGSYSSLKGATCFQESLSSGASKKYDKQAADIFFDEDSFESLCETTDDSSLKAANENTFSVPRPVINFSLAIKNRNGECMKTNLDENLNDSVTFRDSYLFENKIFTDLPSFDVSQPQYSITIKCNKEKLKMPVQISWTGQDIYKWFSHKLKIPLEKIKVIHKGKLLSTESITEVIGDKAIFQVIGEQAANEDGIDQRDINVMMKQLNIDRNTAVKTLRQSNDLVDAMLNFSG